jgi:putative hemin transport protein
MTATNPSMTHQPSPPPGPASLAERWATLRADQPRLRIRDAAEQLGVSELELRATEIAARPAGPIGLPGATRLRAEAIRELLPELASLGEIMALTRNRWAVHEKVGVYEPVSFQGNFGLVLDDPIDLRLFMHRWQHALAVSEPIAQGPGAGELRHSLQFFDASGDAIHKVYVRASERAPAFADLVEHYTSPDQSPVAAVEPRASAAAPTPDAEIDVAGFQAAWLELRDTHDFFPLLRKFGVARTQALRLAPEGHAIAVATGSITTLLERAAATETSIMVFVGNGGCIQIHTGPVAKIVPMGPWINVMDPGFNLHLRTDGVAQAWIVRKPTEDGIVTSLELFDADGDNIALLFGERKPGQPEREDWRELVVSGALEGPRMRAR